jgi:anti-sigma factor ChrR (cupin superfamily)
VLDGAQSDEKGTYVKGDMVINPTGSRHSVWSDDGCVVLLHWEKPVRFIEGNTD